MGYQLRLHSQVRAWLTGLRDTEPERARLVGEAMLALIDALSGRRWSSRWSPCSGSRRIPGNSWISRISASSKR